MYRVSASFGCECTSLLAAAGLQGHLKTDYKFALLPYSLSDVDSIAALLMFSTGFHHDQKCFQKMQRHWNLFQSLAALERGSFPLVWKDTWTYTSKTSLSQQELRNPCLGAEDDLNVGIPANTKP